MSRTIFLSPAYLATSEEPGVAIAAAQFRAAPSAQARDKLVRRMARAGAVGTRFMGVDPASPGGDWSAWVWVVRDPDGSFRMTDGGSGNWR